MHNFKLPIEYSVLATVSLGSLALGTVVYHFLEDLTWLDSLYFSVITLATVGYGDILPTTPLSKIFTIFYVLFGVGILVSFFTMLSTRIINRRIDKRLSHLTTPE